MFCFGQKIEAKALFDLRFALIMKDNRGIFVASAFERNLSIITLYEPIYESINPIHLQSLAVEPCFFSLVDLNAD